MLKRFFFLTLLLYVFPLIASSSIYPKNFYTQYQTLSYGTLFHVMQMNGAPLGKVMRQTGEQRELLDFYTPDDELIAQAELQKNGTVTTAKITGANGEKLGWFSTTIYNLYPTDFKLYTHANNLVAIGNMNWLGTRFTLVDPNNAHREFATYSRSRFKLHSDNWYIEINREGEIDPAILIIIGVYQTSLNLGLEGY